MSISEVTVNILGYRILEQIYAGTRTLVYRGMRDDGKKVILKLMRNEYPSFNELVQFRNQYAISKNLDIAGIVKPLSLENYKNGYILVMEDFGCVSLKQRNVETLHATSLQDFFDIAIQIVHTLHQLHSARVIHKDIKPDNIIIHPTTKQVQLIDFSIASLLPRETQQLQNPNVLEGTLAYISPEQTGRMNRGIDYRTDFYSLGVTFYELLTGQLPFSSSDAMELVHCHIAKLPPSVHTVNPSIPPILSDIINIMMAKNAEDRYQSATGILHDLEVCRQQWCELGNITYFELKSRDVSERFVIPEKLYGREAEVKALLEAFARVANPTGGVELILVAGFSGIGKTAVVNEVHKPIVEKRGYFIKGKYDQFQRNIPFSAFVQALRELMVQLLSETEAQLQHWKSQILLALGGNGQVIINVIPELEQLIGKQPNVPELVGSAATNRFNLLFGKFIQVFTTIEHPLVIFLDDLQWADSASLKLMQLFTSQTDTRYLLLIGAYRDNETSPTHPLMVTLEEISASGTAINTITLNPLEKADLNLLIADTLNCSEELAQPLTELVYQKTKGNPFFSNQFLKSLYEDGLISFNSTPLCPSLPRGDERGVGWQCDIAGVQALALTDNVVEFMALQLQKLSPTTQDVLKLAACIGNQFDLATLAIVYEKSPTETAADLWQALQQGLVIPTAEVYKFYQCDANSQLLTVNSHEQLAISHEHPIYKFLHDRVQQAAYSLIPNNQQTKTHLKIGQKLLSNSTTYHTINEDNIFDIVNHLNLGSVLITQKTEREQLAHFNLLAARKAKASTAYNAAIEYLNYGLELLAEDSWNIQYNLTLSLYEEAAEVSYLIGNFVRTSQFVEIVLSQAKTILDKVKINEVNIQAYIAQNLQIKAVETAINILNILDIELPTEVNQSDIQIVMEQTKTNFLRQSIHDLINIPKMTEPEKLAAMHVLSSVMSASYQAAPNLLPLLVCQQVNLSLKHGNTFISAFSYAMYGLILCGEGDIELGCEVSELALQLLSIFKEKQFKCKILNVIYGYIRIWKYPLRESLNPLLEAYQAGLESGDFEFACNAAYNYFSIASHIGEELTVLANRMEIYGHAMLRYKQEAPLNVHKIFWQTVLNLIGKSEYKYQVIGEIYDEQIMFPIHLNDNNSFAIYLLHINKTYLSYLFHEYEQAEQHCLVAEKYVGSLSGAFHVSLFYFYDSLIKLALFSEKSPEERELIMAKVTANQQRIKEWAEHAPKNYWHKFYLVEAEIHRVLKQNAEAIEYYDRTINLAKENEYLNDEALAYELAAQFYQEWGKEKIACVYLVDAYYTYARWGAKAKVDDLEKRYPQIFTSIFKRERNIISSGETLALASNRISSTSTTTTDVLDLSTVMKAAQVISGEMQLERLLETLMRVVLENAGATKCALVLPQDGNWVIDATSCADRVNTTLLQSIPLENSQEVPISLINYVIRTAQTLLIDNATVTTSINQSLLFHNDPYIKTIQPKSLMCTPILNQGKLIGVLYLENHLMSGAFTSNRVEILNLLCSQAAISLENARLYQQALIYAQQLESSYNSLQQMQLQLVQSEKMSALGNLVAGVAHEINNPVGFIAGNIQPAVEYVQDLFHLLDLYQEKLPHPDADIKNEIEAMDLEYVRNDLPKLLHSMKEGVVRIRSISNSLRTFSRADTENKVPFNIHDGIDSTILILKHRIKASEIRGTIEVIKEYGNLPQIQCFPGQLNQVFMNLLANAIDAIEEGIGYGAWGIVNNNLIPIPQDARTIAHCPLPIAHCPTIRIRTELNSNKTGAVIRIADNGMGMSAEVRGKIFDHLFTTKAVGKGTGLGLAIAHQIVVEKHGGNIEVISAPGQGAEFVIDIPL